MKQQPINYQDVIDLGFKSTIQQDPVFFNQYGFDWRITELKLCKHVYIDWDNNTRFCQMIRLDKEGCNILRRKDIKNLDEFKEIIDFFKNK
jgi:hypothetical protein